MSALPPNPPEGRPLSKDEVRAALAGLEVSADSPIGRISAAFARRIGGDGGDLLHQAIEKALTTRDCPAGLPIEQSIAGIVRSITSTVLRARERDGDARAHIPFDDLVEGLALGGYAVRSADEIIEIERVRQLCVDLLDRLAASSERQAALIDAIDQGLRGRELADHLGVSVEDLATLRRGLKRQVQRLWPEVEREINGG